MTQRIEFIDQLKGLAMLMVVFGHLLQFSFGIPDSPWESILEAFDLPLFFFVSGYFCMKKEGIRWGELPGQIVKRMRAYLLPLISVGILYCVLTDYSFNHLVMSGGGKLWFLYTLFWLAVICLLVSVKSPPSSLQGKLLWKGVAIDLVVFLLPFVGLYALKLLYPDAPGILPWGHAVTYYPYFVIGILMRKYDVLEQLMRTNVWLYTLGIVFFVLGVKLFGLTNKALILLAATGAIVALWHYFSNIEKQNVCTRTLGVIGKHTLAIYVFHYFFIPDLRTLSEMLEIGNPFIIHMVACLLLCACIIPVCIVIEKFVERSPLLGFLMLGKK